MWLKLVHLWRSWSFCSKSLLVENHDGDLKGIDMGFWKGLGRGKWWEFCIENEVLHWRF